MVTSIFPWRKLQVSIQNFLISWAEAIEVRGCDTEDLFVLYLANVHLPVEIVQLAEIELEQGSFCKKNVHMNIYYSSLLNRLIGVAYKMRN